MPVRLRGLIEIHVAAVLHAAAQIERAVAVLAPAMEPRIAQVEVAGAVDAVAGRDRCALQPGQRHRHLEGRARRIKAGGRLVDQRRAPVLRPLRPLRLRDAGVEQRRIEGRVGGHRQHLAVAAVQHHGAGALVAEPASTACCSAASMVRPTSSPCMPSCRSSSRITRPSALTSSCTAPARPRRSRSWDFSMPARPTRMPGSARSGSSGHVVLVGRRDVAHDMGELSPNG